MKFLQIKLTNGDFITEEVSKIKFSHRDGKHFLNGISEVTTEELQNVKNKLVAMGCQFDIHESFGFIS